MPVDMFIDIAGCPGESKDAVHSDLIDVLVWSWGVSQSGSFHAGPGGGAGKVNVQDISFTKWVDKSSPNLLLSCCNGKHIDTADLYIRKAGGDNPLEYLVVKMKKVMVTSVSTGGSGSEDRLTENVTLNFAAVAVDYQAQDDKGAKSGGPVSFKWDIPANKSQ